MRLPTALFYFCIAALAGSFAVRAEAAVDITELPYIIKHSGVYVLRIDGVFKHTAGTAITIDANNVTLDLDDHSLTNVPMETGPTMAVGIATQAHNNLTIRNGAIRGFRVGLDLSSPGTVGEILVNNVTCDECKGAGFVLTGDSIDIRSCALRNTGGSPATVDTLIGGMILTGNYANVSGNQITNTVAIQGSQTAIGMIMQFDKACIVDGNVVANGTVTSNSTGISANASVSFLATNNKIASFATGLLFLENGKYRDNLTINCTTPFSGGTAVGTNNN
jgi:hypothetical protein